MKNGKKKIKKMFLSGMFILFVLLIALIVAGAFVGKYYENGSRVDELDKLKQEIEALERSNSEMDKILEYFNSSFFIEKEAREKMGLKKDGEKVVIIDNNNNKPNYDYNYNDIKDYNISTLTIDNSCNSNFCNPLIVRWFNYFFSNI